MNGQKRLAWTLIGICALTVTRATAQDRVERVPGDTCILELTLPEGATVKVDGRDYGTKRRLVYGKLQPGKTYVAKVHMTFPGGQHEDHKVLVEGGRLVRLASLGRSAIRPELVLQTGHTGLVKSVAFSPTGQCALTRSVDGRVILWDVGVGRQLRTYPGTTDFFGTALFSPDGRMVLTSMEDNTAVLWDASTGEKQRTFPAHQLNGKSFGVMSAAFSPDDRFLATGGADTVNLWDAGTGERLRSFSVEHAFVYSLAFSPDGAKIATSSGNVALWDTATGKKLRTLAGPKGGSTSVTFRGDGRQILAGFGDNTAVLWDAETGRRLHVFRTDLKHVGSVAFSPDSQRLITCVHERPTGSVAIRGQVLLWDATTGENLQTVGGHYQGAFSAAFSPDGRDLLIGSGGPPAFLWHIASQRVVRTFRAYGDFVQSVEFGPRGRRLLLGSRDASLWDLDTGKQLQTFRFQAAGGVFTDFSPDGRCVLTGGVLEDNTSQAIVWDTVIGEKLHTLHRTDSPYIRSGAFCLGGRQVIICEVKPPETSERKYPFVGKMTSWDTFSGEKLHKFRGNIYPPIVVSHDGRLTLSCTSDGTAVLWETATEKNLRTFEKHNYYGVSAVAFSPDGEQLVTAYHDGTVILRNTRTGQTAMTFHHVRSVVSVVFSPDALRLLTGSHDFTAKLWDLVTGKNLQTFRGAFGPAAFSPAGRHVLTLSTDGSTSIRDVNTGRELARLMSLDSGNDWLVTTPEGFFDGSASAREKVMFRVGGGLNVVPVDRFFQDFYYPGLLAAIWRGERPLPKVEMGRSLPPKVKIVSPEKGGLVEADRVTLEVEVSDEGGGVRGPWLVQNDARVLAPEKTEQKGKTVRRTFEIALVQGDNKLEFHAASADGSWESEPAVITLRYEQPLPKPELYLVSVGINRYADESMNLNLAAGDARTMAGLFQQRGPVLYNEVHTTTLLDEEATAPAILQSLRDLAKKARPQDTVAVFLAGHGTVVGRQYYFLPHEFQRQADSLEEDVHGLGLSAARIQETLVAIPALKRIVVFDTGQSGGRVGLARTARDPFAFRGAIERLSRSSGAFMMAAAAASDQAQEVPDLGHGVLTYTLLAGLHAAEGGPLEDQWIQPTGEDRVAEVLDWFGFASSHVPRLTKQYFGRQQEVQHSSLGTSFPVLPVPASDKPIRIALADDSVSIARPKPTSVTHGSGQAKLHLVAVGINQYREEAMNLKFAGADVKAMVELFGKRGKRQYREVSVAEVLDRQATKQGILDALEKVAGQAQPDDTLVVFLSGHGRMVGQRYYCPNLGSKSPRL